MARSTFGGTAADFTFAATTGGYLKLEGATLTCWDAQAGGTQYVDLLVGGIAASSVTVGDGGQIPEFQGPDGVTALWVDGGAGRVLVTPSKPLDEANAHAQALVDGLPIVAQTGAYADLIGKPMIPASAADVGALPATTTPADLGAETPAGAQAKVQAAIDALLAGAPGALDTLNELATALNDDANFAATVTQQLAAKLDATAKGAAGGIAPLDDSGLLPDANVPARLSQATLSATIAAGSVDTLPPSMGNSLTKYGVVIDLGAAGSFDNWRVEGLTTMLDPVSGRIAGVYVGYSDDGTTQRGTIGLAWSDDGANFAKAGQLLPQSGVSGAPDENGCTGPVLMHDGGTYHLFYIGLTATGYEGGTKSLCRASTTDLEAALTDPSKWTRHGAVLSPGGTGWRKTAVYHPSFTERDGTWYCFINCFGADGHETIGYASASSLDGVWAWDDANSPLIQPQAGLTIAGDPCVYRVPGGWRMDFYQSDGASFAADYYALTTDAAFPLGWALANGGNPILQPTEGYDGLYAAKPFIMRLGGRTFHYYTAVATGDDQRRTCALATDPPLRANMENVKPPTAINRDAWLSGLIDSLQPFGYPNVTPPGVLVKDTFSAATFGTADTGQAWTTQAGTVKQERGILHAATLGGASNDTALVTIDPGQTNVTIDCDLAAAMPNPYESISVCCRVQDASNYIELRIDQSQKTTWVVWAAGSISTVPANINTAWNVGDHITVRDDGSNIAVYQNGKLVGTAALTTYNTATAVGLRWGSYLNTEVDNFTVTATI